MYILKSLIMSCFEYAEEHGLSFIDMNHVLLVCDSHVSYILLLGTL